MKVIALRGDANTGKSHTINIAYYLLLTNGYVQTPGYFRVLGDPRFEDVFDILEKNGRKIGIVGQGDYVRKKGSTLQDHLAIQDANGCDTVICACRSHPKIEQQVQHYTNHHFVDKSHSGGVQDHRIVNLVDAQAIINLV